jgi:hypothetical protein
MITAVTDHQLHLLEAWSTFAAMLFAATAAVLAYRAYSKESRIEQRLRDNDDRAQASMVAAWIGVNPAQANSNRARQSFVIVRNASQVPVNDVTCWVEGPNGDQIAAEWSVVPPAEQGVFFPIGLKVSQIAQQAEKPSADLPVGIIFTDSSGVRWRRNPDGRLHRLGQVLP